jgi:DNA topoisomerase II
MIAFDPNGKLRKYESPEEILEEFYPLRLQYYQKRKVCLVLPPVMTGLDDNQDHVLNELSNELDKLNNQARFVKMIVDKELIVSNRKKADIVAELRGKDFKPFPKVSLAKEAGETADVAQEEPEAPTVNNESNSDFDYLLGMAIWNLTKEKVRLLVHGGAVLEATSLLFTDRQAQSTSKSQAGSTGGLS